MCKEKRRDVFIVSRHLAHSDSLFSVNLRMHQDVRSDSGQIFKRKSRSSFGKCLLCQYRWRRFPCKFSDFRSFVSLEKCKDFERRRRSPRTVECRSERKEELISFHWEDFANETREIFFLCKRSVFFRFCIKLRVACCNRSQFSW